ncbi:MAG: undecaprenyl-diphosphatase [Saprospiraceae bacterium]|jgi:undecaprenyl-diphosphatase
MSELLRSILLGIIQGLTEFLPVSSSGHLEIFNALFAGDQKLDSDFTMVLLVHLGTSLSIVWVFWEDILNIFKGIFTLDRTNEEVKLVGEIIISMIPALVIGLLFEERIEAMFEGGIMHIGFFLLFTAGILWITPQLDGESSGIGWKKAFLIGLAQAVAIMPGISRSGMTIAAALFLGTGKKEAARFSFLMVLPVIFGKMILDFVSGDFQIDSTNMFSILAALVSSFIVGIIACRWMISIVRDSKLQYFAIYCGIVGLLVIAGSLYG